jgi:antitoxin (DNA-binding transcriptional repressor) of toxin-antitoxin stability system
MAWLHTSEAEAARDFALLMTRVRAGAEVVIENETVPAAVIHTPVPPRRSICECIALAKKHEEETGRTESKHIEKLRYRHQNPVARGLVEKPEDWQCE